MAGAVDTVEVAVAPLVDLEAVDTVEVAVAPLADWEAADMAVVAGEVADMAGVVDIRLVDYQLADSFEMVAPLVRYRS